MREARSNSKIDQSVALPLGSGSVLCVWTSVTACRFLLSAVVLDRSKLHFQHLLYVEEVERSLAQFGLNIVAATLSRQIVKISLESDGVHAIAHMLGQVGRERVLELDD